MIIKIIIPKTNKQENKITFIQLCEWHHVDHFFVLVTDLLDDLYYNILKLS